MFVSKEQLSLVDTQRRAVGMQEKKGTGNRKTGWHEKKPLFDPKAKYWEIVLAMLIHRP